MNTIAQDTMIPILKAENEATAKLYGHAGLGDEFRAPLDVQSHQNVIAEFTRRGYEIRRLPHQTKGAYQMLLLHNGNTIACVDIIIKIEVGELVV